MIVVAKIQDKTALKVPESFFLYFVIARPSKIFA